MYKGASNSQNYMKREGSKSLRPLRAGDNSASVPPTVDVSYTVDKARNRVYEAGLVSADIEAVKIKLAIAREQRAELNFILSSTLPFEVFAEKKKQSVAIGLEQQRLQNELLRLKNLLKSLNVSKTNSFERAFINIAEESLPRDVFEKILQATRDYFGEQGIAY